MDIYDDQNTTTQQRDLDKLNYLRRQKNKFLVLRVATILSALASFIFLSIFLKDEISPVDTLKLLSIGFETSNALVLIPASCYLLSVIHLIIETIMLLFFLFTYSENIDSYKKYSKSAIGLSGVGSVLLVGGCGIPTLFVFFKAIYYVDLLPLSVYIILYGLLCEFSFVSFSTAIKSSSFIKRHYPDTESNN